MNARALIVALFTAAAVALCIPRPASAAPALWVVQSSAAKIYLFGTVHLLRDGTQWRTPELEAAIGESQDLYLEIADPTNRTAILASVMKLGLDRAHPLSTKLSKSDSALLDEVTKRYGYTEAALEPMQPWLAFILLSTLPAINSGYAGANGVDLQIRKDFVAAGKPVNGLETVDAQVRIFADMPEATQVALLDGQLKVMAARKPVDSLDALVGAWLSGNEDDLAKSLQIGKFAQSPIYARIFTDRNKAWAAELAERLKQPGTSFVCVGAAHLVGTDGVPALLARMGYTVSRVQIAATPAPTSPTPAPMTTPSPSAATLTPPAEWKGRSVSLSSGLFKGDSMWSAPSGGGMILLGHLDLAAMGSTDLDTLDGLFHQGLTSAAGANGVQPSTRVKICGGKQDATYTIVTLPNVKEDIVLATIQRRSVRCSRFALHSENPTLRHPAGAQSARRKMTKRHAPR